MYIVLPLSLPLSTLVFKVACNTSQEGLCQRRVFTIAHNQHTSQTSFVVSMYRLCKETGTWELAEGAT